MQSINWWAVVVSILAYLFVGGLWFGAGRNGLYRLWLRAMQKPGDFKPGGRMRPVVLWPLSALAATVQAIALAVLVNALGNLIQSGPTLVSGMLTGFLLWLGLVAPASLTNKLFADHPKAWLLETGNQLLDYLLMGAILGAWH